MPNARITLVAALVLTAAACASQGSAATEGTIPSSTAATPRVPDVISLAELSDPSIGDLDALTTIKRLRPAFLATRGGAGISMSSPVTGIQVTVNGGPLQPVATLSNIRSSEIVEIRYLNTSAAAQAYGSASGAAAVLVVKRK